MKRQSGFFFGFQFNNCCLSISQQSHGQTGKVKKWKPTSYLDLTTVIGLNTNPTEVRAIAPANRLPDGERVGRADDLDGEDVVGVVTFGCDVIGIDGISEFANGDESCVLACDSRCCCRCCCR